MQLKAVIFDFGGVLCFHPPEQEIRELAALSRVDREQFERAYWSLRHPYDRGDMDPHDYWRRLGETLGQSYTAEEVEEFRRRDVHFWVHLDARMLDWAKQVRAAGFRTALLSNLPADLGEHLRNGMKLVSHFDHHSFSYELRSAKPEAGIYRHAVEGLGVEPHEALFIDDRPENIEGARAVGLHAVHFESCARLEEQLQEVGGSLPGFSK